MVLSFQLHLSHQIAGVALWVFLGQLSANPKFFIIAFAMSALNSIFVIYFIRTVFAGDAVSFFDIESIRKLFDLAWLMFSHRFDAEIISDFKSETLVIINFHFIDDNISVIFSDADILNFIKSTCVSPVIVILPGLTWYWHWALYWSIFFTNYLR